MRKLPREVHNALAKAQTDLEWAVRMLNDSVAPESLDVDLLVTQISIALRDGQAAAVGSRSERGSMNVMTDAVRLAAEKVAALRSGTRDPLDQAEAQHAIVVALQTIAAEITTLKARLGFAAS